MIEGCFWKTDPTTYNLQIKIKNISDLKMIKNLLKDWKLTGTGFDKTGDINIFCKQIKNPRVWSEFAKRLPLMLFECDKDGNKKQIKTALVSTKKTKIKVIKETKQSGRRCGKCGKLGHNTRTCK